MDLWKWFSQHEIIDYIINTALAVSLFAFVGLKHEWGVIFLGKLRSEKFSGISICAKNWGVRSAKWELLCYERDIFLQNHTEDCLLLMNFLLEDVTQRRQCYCWVRECFSLAFTYQPCIALRGIFSRCRWNLCIRSRSLFCNNLFRGISLWGGVGLFGNLPKNIIKFMAFQNKNI